MANYTGIPCAHCGKLFAEGDDVVVCPECGAPHHRHCYNELGHCALEDRHESGVVWQGPAVKKDAGADRICGHCGAVNPADGVFCRSCGSKLDDVANEGAHPQPDGVPTARTGPASGRREEGMQTPVGVVTPDEEFDGVTAREIAAYVGPNSRYYLTAFKVMKESGKKYSFTWSAFLFNYCYFFYRKMWKSGLLLLLVAGLFLLPQIPYLTEGVKEYLSVFFNYPVAYDVKLLESLTGMMRIINWINLIISLAIAVFGNYLYYNHVIRSIRSIRQQLPPDLDKRVYLSTLQQKGGVSVLGSVAGVLVTMAAFTAISYRVLLQMML